MIRKLFILRSLLIFILFFLCLVSCSPKPLILPSVQKGVLDLRSWDFSSQPILDLSGEWSYYPQVLFQDLTPSSSTDRFYMVPSTWPGDGYAVVRLKVLLPEHQKRFAIYSKWQSTAFRLILNGKAVASSGIPGKTKETSIPDNLPLYYEWDDSGGNLDLIFEISNFHHRVGGFWYHIRFGEASALSEEVRTIRDWDFFLAGIFFLAGLYHLWLFFLHRIDRGSLVFALFCFVIFLRIFVTEEKFLLYYFHISYRLSMILEYVTMYAAMPLAMHFLRYTFPDYFPRKWILFFYGLSFVFSLSLLFPFPFPSSAVPYFQGTFFFAVAVAIYVIFRALAHKAPYSLPITFAFLSLICAGTFDVLSAHQLIFTRFIIPVGLLIAVFNQAFILSSKYRDLYREKEKLSERLMRLNDTYSRFVPLSFLEFLGKDKLEDMRPGDQIKKEMTILFADIRSFTEISESIDSKESFELLNSYISEMEPVIQAHRGFVDKYFGDAIMALFSDTDDAVSAAISMQNRILEYNQRRIEKGERAIRVGIGIHTGSLMMGIVGSGGRMESTVISEAVHLASKLETLNKYYGSNILISEDTLRKLKGADRFVLRRLDRLKFKGKMESLNIHEVGDYLSTTEKEAFRNSRINFERGVDLFHSGKYMDAGESFREVLRIYSGDKAANLYLKRCTEQISPSSGKVQPGPDLA
ncbi:adenylate/guanylate cyclase domain-containing protein [Leptospira langatensis]|uniref:Adenylate/guanylate cyclase domain-containing protein n=1 Tax=Leptospira langatensis TaxID=2484983 RepID=A0A5F1ZVH9_9LEPT|nr:adenylate/guanylate cyclase domain-containing protein [Leptospira langatensis]TGK00174.1 adenylate/guanylate cyclase domain-containing protein [Leptospira langatensis]TGL41196.1 adenylate/guanylate cyclase domain-containing protein [Leptospira langatensis]